jgi:hypothetical protein
MSHAIYRSAELIVRAWVGLYLVGVPRQARRQRRAEIASDLYEHRVDVREQGRSPAAAALRLLVRCIAGAFDDLLWRSEVGDALGGTGMLRRMHAPGRVALATALILMLPLIAMQFTDDVAWNLFDFVFAGVLLFSAGLAYELLAKRMSNIAYRAAAGLSLVTALFLVVSLGAVGIIGSEDNPANLMYFGVIAVGIGGAIIARFQPRGMARTLFAMALAQTLIAVIALIAVEIDPAWWGEADRTQDSSPFFGVTPTPVLQILGVNGMFIALFLGSAVLFQTAARGQSPTSARHQG